MELEKPDDILMVENECELIKPIFITKKNKYFETNKTNFPISEILNILNTPLHPNYNNKKRPNNKNINSHLFQKEIENNLKYVINININQNLNSKKELNNDNTNSNDTKKKILF